MERKNTLTKVLAISGTCLIWFPLVVPVIFSVDHLIRAGIFLLDYLMPAELFVVVLLGGGLLIWAAVRARRWYKLVSWSVGLSVILLLAGMGFAVFSGLASGETEPDGWIFILGVGLIVLYDMAVIVTAVGGILLLRDLLGKKKES